MFSNPTSPPRSPIGSVPFVPSYTLSSPAFKGVICGISFKHNSPPLCYPWYMQVPGAIWETWVQVPLSGVPRVCYNLFESKRSVHFTIVLFWCLETEKIDSFRFVEMNRFPYSPKFRTRYWSTNVWTKFTFLTIRNIPRN